MEKISSLIIIGLLLSSLFFVFTPQVNGQEAIIFQDDFETYQTGTFPSEGGWKLVYNGAGNQYQVITSDYAASGAKSLQMVGLYGWSAVVAKDFSSTSNLIGFEAYLMGTPGSWLSVGFGNEAIQPWGRMYGAVGVNTIDGYIVAGSQNLQPCTVNTWYKIRVVMDRNARTFDVWINDQLRGTDIPEENDPWEIQSLRFDVGWHQVMNYYDKVKVYEVGGTPSRGDLSITNIEPVQTLINPSIIIPGKPTIFKVIAKSTFVVNKMVHMLITCSEYGRPTESWYEGPYTIEPNQATVIYTGGKGVWGQNYRPSGEFEVKIKIDAFNLVAESNENNNEYTKRIGSQNGYAFKNLGQLKVLYVPIGFWGGPYAWLYGDPPITNEDMQRQVGSSNSFINAVFPVDPKNYKSEIAGKVEMVTPCTLFPAVRHLEALIEFNRQLWFSLKYCQPGMGGYDRLVAVVPYRGDGLLPWFEYWLNIPALGYVNLLVPEICWAEEGWWYVPAHELLHSYTRRGHCSGEGNGYWDRQHSEDDCGLVHYYNIPCLMKENAPQNHRFSAFDTIAWQWICPQCYADLTRLDRFKRNDDPEILFVSGVAFNNNTVDLQPFYYFPEGYADLESDSIGNYTLRFLDSNLQILDDFGFNVTFEQDFNVSGFGFAVPYPSGVAQIQILHGANIVASRNVSANAPTVSITYPNDGETFVSGENVTIMWEANDADNETLSFTVLYTPDDGTSWIPIQTGISETCLNWTVPDDHPTDQCRIKVVATDGVNTGEDLSDLTFTILRHDIAVLDIEASTYRIRGGNILPFNVTIENRGNYTETFTIEVYANTTLLQTKNVTLTSGNITGIPLTWNTSGFEEGSYIVKAYISQIQGEINTLDNQCYMSVEIDSTAPVISILSPQEKTYYSTRIPLTFETNEPASWVAYSLNNQPNVTISDNIIIDITDGTYQITVYANDTAGNIGVSQTIHFTINSSRYYPWESSFIGPGNTPIVDFAVYNGRFYAVAGNKLYVYDKYSWNMLNAPAYITSLLVHEDKLIIGARNGLYYSLDGKTMFSLIFSVPTYIKVLGAYNGRLYAGTMLDSQPTLYYCNGSAENPADWHVDTDFSLILGFSGPFGSIDSFAIYDNAAYISSGGKLLCYNGTAWSIAVSYLDVYAFLDMQVYNGKLYLATRDQGWRKPLYQGGTGFSGRVIEYDGSNWATILDHNYWIFSLETYEDKLYAGTANKIYAYDGANWNLSFNAIEDAYYAIALITFDGKIFAGMGNGYIFVDPLSEPMTVPEFPSAIFLPLLITLSLLLVITEKRRPHKRLTSCLFSQCFQNS
ncbi:MAG: hypothetical protein QXZ70_01125 [Candidatus Bathyarchaeia archaeon]